MRVEDGFAFFGVRAEDDLALDEVRAGAPRDEVFRGGEGERMLSERMTSSDDEETVGGGREVDASRTETSKTEGSLGLSLILPMSSPARRKCDSVEGASL